MEKMSVIVKSENEVDSNAEIDKCDTRVGAAGQTDDTELEGSREIWAVGERGHGGHRDGNVYMQMSQLYERERSKALVKHTPQDPGLAVCDTQHNYDEVSDESLHNSTNNDQSELGGVIGDELVNRFVADELEDMRVLTTRCKKRKAYTIIEKLKIAEQVKNGETYASISRTLGIPESTVRNWIKDEARLRDMTVISETGSFRMKMRHANYKKVDEALYLWYWQQRANGESINGPLLQEKARRLAKQLHGDDNKFVGSAGWLNRFKHRHGLLKSSRNDYKCEELFDGDGLNTRHGLDNARLNRNSVKLSADCDHIRSRSVDNKHVADDISVVESNEAVPSSPPGQRMKIEESSIESRTDTNMATEMDLPQRHPLCNSYSQGSYTQIFPITNKLGRSTKRLCTRRRNSESNETDTNPPFSFNERVAHSQNGVHPGTHEVPSVSDAVAGLETALRWFVAHEETVVTTIISLRGILKCLRASASVTGREDDGDLDAWPC